MTEISPTLQRCGTREAWDKVKETFQKCEQKKIPGDE
jgi:hypothetical protein